MLWLKIRRIFEPNLRQQKDPNAWLEPTKITSKTTFMFQHQISAHLVTLLCRIKCRFSPSTPHNEVAYEQPTPHRIGSRRRDRTRNLPRVPAYLPGGGRARSCRVRRGRDGAERLCQGRDARAHRRGHRNHRRDRDPLQGPDGHADRRRGQVDQCDAPQIVRRLCQSAPLPDAPRGRDGVLARGGAGRFLCRA